MLINWMVSSILLQQQQPPPPPKSMIPPLLPTQISTMVSTAAAGVGGNNDQQQQDINANNPLILQFCTNLLVAGVIRQIPDKYAPVQESFRVSEKIIF